ncbi:Zinc finger CCCH domain-containing protein 53 [Platanthera zijinensis]|uniref:Zinc finger CCCH domain-containing protein 53 n=1 Tax=Platanthera zijinensis TaxID=2320716 RepID=A0AAP0C257_9ASPA
MDAYEATKLVFSRIQSLDPINAAEIMGTLLIQEHGEKEMIRLAFGPESLLLSFVLNARKDLGLLPPSSPSSVFLLGPHSSSISSSASPTPFPEERFRDGGINRRNCSVSGLCLFFARGYCKNGSKCRFLHYDVPPATGKLDDMVDDELLQLQSTIASAFPFSPSSASGRELDFLLQYQLQRQLDSQRAVAVTPAVGRGEPPQKFFSRPRLDRCDFAGIVNPCSRQIYLTFPADSAFREEDVSIYFSLYGPVQDVRIPCQLKRMFGFVTFLYPETVKLILAKGNPHFVCDARVLVKPYKEKGKMLDKKQQQTEDWGDFSGPTEISSRNNQCINIHPLGARTRYGSCRQDALLQRQFMGLHLLDQISRNPPPPAVIHPAASPPLVKDALICATLSTSIATSKLKEGWLDEEKSLIPASLASAAFSPADQEEKSCKIDGDLERGGDHNLPDSPFASPTKPSFSSEVAAAVSSSPALLSSTLLPTSTLESMAPFRPFFFQMPWHSSGAGAMGL